MRSRVKIVSIVAALAVGIAIAGGYSIYRASQRVPEFYHVALSIEPESQQEARDAFVARATALASDLHEVGQWQSLFTADQINAWLALEMATNYPELLPNELREPRVSLAGGAATIGCRYEASEMTTVLSLTVEIYLHEPNVVALRVRRARAGALPVPLGQVLDSISHAAQQLNLRLEWRKTHGDPVALVTIPQLRNGESAELHLESLEVRDGELFVAGTVGRELPDASPVVPEPLRVPTAKRDEPDDQPLVGAAQTDTRQK